MTTHARTTAYESTDDATVVAVVVTYRRHNEIRATLEALCGQPGLTAVVVVDNANDLVLTDACSDGLTVVTLASADNLGFGAGLALGMTHALEHFDPDFYWLMDDDSAPLAGALAESLAAAAGLEKLASVNTRAGSFQHGRIRHLPPNDSPTPRPVDWTLVDGSLISRAAVELAGVPRRDLFMMLEDFEYTTRFADFGLVNYQRAGSVSSPQHLGSGGIWRHYYQSRNLLRIAIERRSLWGAAGWAGREFRIQTTLIMKRRPRVVLLRWQGTRDAVLGRMGRQVEPG